MRAPRSPARAVYCTKHASSANSSHSSSQQEIPHRLRLGLIGHQPSLFLAGGSSLRAASLRVAVREPHHHPSGTVIRILLPPHVLLTPKIHPSRTMAIQRRRRSLPAELIGVVCTHCDLHTLARLALVSTSVHYEAQHVLYRDIVLHRHLSSSRKRACIQSLLNDSAKVSRVRALTYQESCVVPLSERAEIIRLLAVLLKRAAALHHLDLWIYPETDVQALKSTLQSV